VSDALGPALHASSAEAILRQLPVGLVVAECPGGRVLHVSERVEEIWGRRLEPPSSIAWYGVWRGFHPDGRPYTPAEWPLARAVESGERVEDETIEIERGDGTRGVIRVCAAPLFDEEGTRVGATSTLRDVTAETRREWERSFLQAAGTELATSLDLGTTLRSVARLALPRLADWCAVDLLDERGRVQRLVVEHQDAERAATARELERCYPPLLTNRLGVGKVLRTGEAEIYRRIDDEMAAGVAQDARHLRLMREMGLASAMVVPLQARGRTLGALVFVTRDAARAYGAAELELACQLSVIAAMAIDNARLYDESQAANRAKADFLAIISHELRTPLTAIIGYTELMQLGVPDPIGEGQREQVERIDVSARHLLRLIEEILTMATLETGYLEARSEEVRLRELLEDARVIVSPVAAEKGLEVEVAEVPSGLVVQSDPDKLLQVILNLATNAVKFTEAGSVRLGASAEEEHVAITVTDTGVGIDRKHWESVFLPFWQVEQPVTRRAGGTGLGLAITQRLIRLLGGSIEVDAEAGRGSTFTVRVPLER
jgi:signal transduction histidine kinase